ncbi:hypothetical protein A6U85_01505 [Agrobacterium sp. 13-626]|nr:hypothetical protein CN09_05035 [Rhizobium rhizogenes]OCJ05685.1 hypothetical protein A6U85_01505 [Agrobacterium sp. 13-626]OCJ14851.1 hypothetical protein A6U89_22335 [Agrobacterium sp. B133/95]
MIELDLFTPHSHPPAFDHSLFAFAKMAVYEGSMTRFDDVAAAASYIREMPRVEGYSRERRL